MTDNQPNRRLINRSLKTAKLLISTKDNMSSDRKPLGEICALVNPLNRVTMSYKIPVITPGSSFAFFDLVEGLFLIQINSAYYLKKTFSLALPFQNTLQSDDEINISQEGDTLIATVTLIPSPVYILAAGMTVIRILFRKKSDEKPVVNGKLYALKQNNGNEQAIFVSRTDDNGQALLCCNRMTRDSILQINGFDFGGPKQFQLRAVDVFSDLHTLATVSIKEFWSNDLILELNI